MTTDRRLPEERRLKILNEGDQQAEISLMYSTVEPYWLRAELEGLSLDYQDVDLFACLSNLRRDLEGKGTLICCAGARRDVATSGMTRQMSGGRLAYVHPPDRRPGETDLVNIFDPAPSELVCTLREQAEAIRSIRARVSELLEDGAAG